MTLLDSPSGQGPAVPYPLQGPVFSVTANGCHDRIMSTMMDSIQ